MATLPGACARAQHMPEVAPESRGPSVVASADTTAAIVDSNTVALELSGSTTRFHSKRDSVNWTLAKARADKAGGYRVVVSLFDRRLWVLSGEDTVRVAPVAVAKGTTLEFAGKSWNFRTPRGVRKVLAKDSLPIWTPPDWHYAEVAAEHGLKLAKLPLKKPVKLKDGTFLVVRDSLVGVMGGDSVFAPLPTDEEVVFDSVLYIPPVGTRNRQIDGELGRYKLDLGDGYLLHGTPNEATIGRAATHGCIRLRDEDITWLYENIPLGTRVFIY